MILEIKDITKNYDRAVLKNISYSFSSGKIYIIKGVSGCGKSTLLNVLGGIEPSFDGKVYLDGREVETCSEEYRCRCGYIFQQSLLLSGITVRENLILVQNDIDRIERLYRDLDIVPLLDKYPDELSGGERQRIAIVRALLNDAQILLADEPTASLDKHNSERIAKTIAELRSDDRILIISTHENYFDSFADEIINLNYGVFEVEQSHDNMQKGIVSRHSADPTCRRMQQISSVTFNLKRHKSNLKLFALIPFAFLFTIIMLVSTFQHNFSDECYFFIKKQYPIEAFNMRRDLYDAAPPSIYKDYIHIYDEYRISDDGVTAMYLAERQDSVLTIDGMLEYGSFPEKPNEVIVNNEYAMTLLGDAGSLKQCVGKKIVFCDKEIVVSGILYKIDRALNAEQGARNPEFYSYLFSDIYYTDIEDIDNCLMFIPYETLKTMADPLSNNEYIRCVCRGVFDDDATYSEVKKIVIGTGHVPGSAYLKNFTLNVFEKDIRDLQSSVDLVGIILGCVLVVCFVIACVFISSQVQIELFYRRKELGYLQIFGIKKKRLHKLVLTGYVLKIVFSLSISCVLYAVCLILYYTFSGRIMYFNIFHTSIIVCLIVVFYLGSVNLSIAKFLRSPIVDLITK